MLRESRPELSRTMRHNVGRVRTLRWPATEGGATPPPDRPTLTPLPIRDTVLQSFARQWRPDEQGQRDAAGLDRGRPHGLRAGQPPARRPATTSRCGTARARRPSRWPSSGPRSSTPRPTSPTATSSSRWSAATDDFQQVVLGEQRPALARRRRAARSSSTRPRSRPAPRRSCRDAAEQRGTAVLAAPVSGNPKVVAAGRLTIVASGPARRVRRRRALPRAASAPASPTSARATARAWSRSATT